MGSTVCARAVLRCHCVPGGRSSVWKAAGLAVLSVRGRFRKVDKSKRIPGKAGQRYYKNVGLGFKTPKEAIEGVREGSAAC